MEATTRLHYVQMPAEEAFEKRLLRVRLFHPRGRYIRAQIAQPGAFYSGNDDIVFSVVESNAWNRAADDVPFYSEMDWLSLNEIRLIGSLMLCEMEEEPRLSMYPIQHYSPLLNDPYWDFSKEESANELKHLVMREIDDPRQHPIPSHMRRSIEACRVERYTLLKHDGLDLSRQGEMWNAIDVQDHLLMRGLFTLIKSDMLSTYIEFTEEAIQSCFISLEATFRMILRRLKADGVANPSSKDAAEWLFEIFDSHLGPEAKLDRYFAEFYDQRVTMLHPESRFGAFPYALVSYDDLYHLRAAIRAILGFLVSGRHDKSFLQLASERRMRN